MYAKLIPRFSRLEEVFKPNLSTNPEDSDELTKKKNSFGFRPHRFGIEFEKEIKTSILNGAAIMI